MQIHAEVLKAISTLMKGEADPFYLYDSEKIRAQCARFKAIPYPEKKVHFATMANIHPRVLEYIKAEGLGVFVNSLIHLKQVQKAGFDSKSIIFTASGLSPKIMRHIQEEKIQVNLDSVGQLEQWERLFANSEIGLRCNIGDQINPKETLYIEDIAKNLSIGKERGAITAWLINDEYWGKKESDKEFIDFKIENLSLFLKEIRLLQNS